ncbi:MAG: extracellular solute-binding protein [Deinococcales bacterium]
MKYYLALVLSLFIAVASAQTTVTIASVNNPDMVTMQELSSAFEAANPDIKLEWLFLDEGTLRSRLTTDVATGSGAFDLVTVGAYETPLWAANDWIASVDALATEYPAAAEGYDFEDLLPAIHAGLSYEGELYAVPFYAESSFTMYNKRIFDEAGLTMPEQPTWEQIAEFACQIHDPENGVYGIALRGKPGWGDNMAPITTVVNTFGGQWFDAEGHPMIDSPAWHEALSFYADLVNRCSPSRCYGQ